MYLVSISPLWDHQKSIYSFQTWIRISLHIYPLYHSHEKKKGVIKYVDVLGLGIIILWDNQM